MKKMTTLVAAAFTAAAIFVGSNANAQSTPKNTLRFGVGVEGLLPTGGLVKDVSNIGLGGTARLQYGVADNLALTLTSGYYNFFGKQIVSGVDAKYPSFGIVPVKAGIKAFVGQNVYLSGEVGAGFETRDVYANTSNTSASNGKATKLIASPGIGWANRSWDIGARYENFSGQDRNYGTVGLRIAYGFGL